MNEPIRLYADENVSRLIIRGLQLRGIDVISTKQAGMLGASDLEQLEFSVKSDRVILTQDDDLLKLHARGISHKGIIYSHQTSTIGDVIRGVLLIHQVLTMNEMANHVEFI